MAIKHAKTFADLSRSRPIIDEIKDEKQTDRAVAIIGAAYIDLLLRHVITARLRPDEKLMKELFEKRGPLQEFGSRIQIAFAMEIYGINEREDLGTIKNIRNAFAHSAEAMDFRHRDIARECEKFRCVPSPQPKTPREQFISVIEAFEEFFYLKRKKKLKRKRRKAQAT